MQAKFVGRWVPSGNNMTTGYAGSSISFKVSSTHNVMVTTSGASRVSYKIDDGPYIKSASNTVQIAGLTLSTHTIKIVLTIGTATWTGANYASVSNITVDPNGEITVATPSKRRMLVFGDSITEGVTYVNGESVIASELTYWNKLGDMLGIDITPCGIGGIGYVTNSGADYPMVSHVPSYIENVSNTLVNTDTDYDIILILLGVNDWKSTSVVDNDYVTAVTGCIERMKIKYPSADIHALIPFNNNGKPSLEQVYNAQGVHIIPQTWYSQITFESSDLLHPNENGENVIANNLKNYFISYYGSAYFQEAIMKRIDTVYIDSNGAVQKATGTMSDNPVKPVLPSGAIRVADVVVEQSASTGTVVANRDWLKVYDNLNLVNVKDYGAAGDGATDDSAAIQSAINNNPLHSIYFPAGTYTVSAPITLSRDGDKRNMLILDNGATLKASDSFPTAAYVVDIGATGDNPATFAGSVRQIGMTGGVVDGNSRAYGGVRVGFVHMPWLYNFGVKNVNSVGVCVNGKNNETEGSSDAYIQNLMISGTKQANSIGLLINAPDNNISNIRTGNFPIGVKLASGGNFVKDVHPLWYDSIQDFEVAFWLTGGNNFLTDCYSDAFRDCIKIDINDNSLIVIDHFFGLYTTDHPTDNNHFIKMGNTDYACNFIAKDVTVGFVSGYTNQAYDGKPYTVSGGRKMCGFYNCAFSNESNAYTDAGISSVLAHNNQFSFIGEGIDFNNIMASGTYMGGGLPAETNRTYHRPSWLYGEVFILEVAGYSGYSYSTTLLCGVIQRCYSVDGYTYIRRGYNGGNGMSWSKWAMVTQTEESAQ